MTGKWEVKRLKREDLRLDREVLTELWGAVASGLKDALDTITEHTGIAT